MNKAANSQTPLLQLWKSSTAITLASVLGTAATAANGFVLAYSLNPPDLGLLALLIAIPTIVVIMSCLGFHFAAIYHLGQGKYNPADILSTVVWVGSAIGFSLTLLGILGSLLISASFRDVPLSTVVIALAAILPQILLVYFIDISAGLDLLGIAILVRILPGGLYLTGTVLLVVTLHLGVAGALAAYLTGTVSATVIGLIMFYRAGYIRLSVNWDFLREGFIFGFKSHLGDIAQYLVYRLDLPLVGYFAGLSAAGYYSIATRLAELIWLPSNTLRAMLLARVSNRKTQDSEEITPYVTRNVLAFGIVFAFALAFSSWLFIQWVLPEYLPSVPLLWVILPGAITASAFRVLIGDIAGRGSPGLVAKIALGGLLGGLALYFILIPRFEAMGASLASSILYTCECSAAMWAVSKLMGDRITEFIVIKKHDLYVLRGLLRSARKMRFDNEHVLR